MASSLFVLACPAVITIAGVGALFAHTSGYHVRGFKSTNANARATPYVPPASPRAAQVVPETRPAQASPSPAVQQSAAQVVQEKAKEERDKEREREKEKEREEEREKESRERQKQRQAQASADRGSGSGSGNAKPYTPTSPPIPDDFPPVVVTDRDNREKFVPNKPKTY